MTIGESYEPLTPIDSEGRMRDLKWWQWPIFCVAVPVVFVYFVFLMAWEWIRYRGKKDFVPGMAKYDYRTKLEKGGKKS